MEISVRVLLVAQRILQGQASPKADKVQNVQQLSLFSVTRSRSWAGATTDVFPCSGLESLATNWSPSHGATDRCWWTLSWWSSNPLIGGPSTHPNHLADPTALGTGAGEATKVPNFQCCLRKKLKKHKCANLPLIQLNKCLD